MIVKSKDSISFYASINIVLFIYVYIFFRLYIIFPFIEKHDKSVLNIQV